MVVGGQRHAPTALLLGKTRYQSYRRLCGAQGRSGQVRKISPPPGFDPRTVQPVTIRYTEWAISAKADEYNVIHFSVPSSLVILLVNQVHDSGHCNFHRNPMVHVYQIYTPLQWHIACRHSTLTSSCGNKSHNDTQRPCALLNSCRQLRTTAGDISEQKARRFAICRVPCAGINCYTRQ